MEERDTSMENMGLKESFWQGKRVLVTGHTGFKGSWLSIWLQKMGAEVAGYALPPQTLQDNFVVSGLASRMWHVEGDILDTEKLEKVFAQFAPEIVFHLAAQPLVRLSYEQPRLTYETNVMGTLNVLEAMRRTPSVKAAVMVTTDKCYENRETDRGYKESDPLGGYDPYSSSKACAEILIASYRSSFFGGKGAAAIASARAGNVIGGGDWAKDRILPDCMRALQRDIPVKLRNPESVRPWQFVLEPLRGYLMLAESLWGQGEEYGSAWNFGPKEDTLSTVREVAEAVVRNYGRGSIEVEQQLGAPHEAGLLCLDITKAREVLGWQPTLDLEETVRMTVEWYRDCSSMDSYDLCLSQIGTYMQKCKGKRV